MEEEYEIMSHSKLNKLKSEVDQLKKGPSKEMHESMNQLKGSMDQMINLFKVAADEMKTERIEEKGVEKKLGPLMEKLDKISMQQNELAKGMVAIADMVKEHFPKIEHELDDIQKMSLRPPKRKPMPAPRPMSPPPVREPKPLPPLEPPGASPFPPPFHDDNPMPPPPGGMQPPPPGMGMPPPPGGMPPPPGPGPMPPLEPLGPPPTEKKKKGLLGGLFNK